MLRTLSCSTLLAVGLIEPTTAQSQAEVFGNEWVKTRAFRSSALEQAPNEGAASTGGHAGGHGHGHQHMHGANDPISDAHSGAEHRVETENVFGFTLGSDTEHAGAAGIAVENIARFGKRDAAYSALGQKLEVAYGVTNDLSVSAALLGDFHRVRPRGRVTTSDEVKGRYIFNGIGAELRYRFLDRRQTPFGLTLHLEPSVALSDEVSGRRGRKYGSENKLIFDRELVPDKLFGAFNLLHEMEWMKGNGAAEIERGTKIGASLALAYQVHTNVFVGAEARYLRAYEGLNMKAYLGDAWFAGPTVSARVGEKHWFSVAYNGLIGGREKGADRRLDLTNFEQHQVRFKMGYEF